MPGDRISIPIHDAVKDSTIYIDVTGMRSFRFRLWIGMQLFKLAAFVIGCGIKVDGLED